MVSQLRHPTLGFSQVIISVLCVAQHGICLRLSLPLLLPLRPPSLMCTLSFYKNNQQIFEKKKKENLSLRDAEGRGDSPALCQVNVGVLISRSRLLSKHLYTRQLVLQQLK